MTVTPISQRRRGAQLAAPDELAALATKIAAEADGTSGELLNGYLQTLAEVSVSRRPPSDDELRQWRDIGARAADLGVPMRSLINLYLRATWQAWPHLPGVRGPDATDRLCPIGESVMRTADTAVMTLAEGYEEVQRWIVRREESLRREFIDDLFDGRDIGGLAERAERYGLHLGWAHVVAAARGTEPFVDGGLIARQVETALRPYFGIRDALVGTKDGLLVCLAPQQHQAVLDEFVRQLSLALGADTSWRVGIGRPQSGAGGVVRSFEQARGALEIGSRLNLPEQVLRARELLVYQVLRRDTAALSELVTEVLEPLRTTRMGAESLLNTLSAYFDSGSVATVAAQRLHVSVRTVTYRLRRVRDLTGYAADDPRQAFALHVAVLGAQLIGWPNQESS
ncbi:PucR family transcriptional regulator [Nonomuraea mesophila]|uniref:PucR family transcriptional regulator n=1 Tax=Nonomuraea mesophila TaxID=2530382 RepID=A0A4R5FY01_9ACTN|nr:helix-turn-helix domain-containing protein [Nonomuraea mesophila]TDE60440.1 PucR family transcriptional regulator [Nonomuraea mesophila]